MTLPLFHPPLWVALAGGLIAGALIGVLHFRALRAQVDALVQAPSLGRLFALQAVRVVLSTLALAAIAIVLGAGALLAAALGLLGARMAAVRFGAPS
ncbi:ATP synthase subunit I [Phenylobacterium sp.]|uniref:N-ATPase subunit AtpR n=1 Tax=Phenylobacterium sp. TaxID=1871053 RepID=UPI0035B02C01